MLDGLLIREALIIIAEDMPRDKAMKFDYHCIE